MGTAMKRDERQCHPRRRKTKQTDARPGTREGPGRVHLSAASAQGTAHCKNCHPRRCQKSCRHLPGHWHDTAPAKVVGTMARPYLRWRRCRRRRPMMTPWIDCRRDPVGNSILRPEANQSEKVGRKPGPARLRILRCRVGPPKIRAGGPTRREDRRETRVASRPDRARRPQSEWLVNGGKGSRCAARPTWRRPKSDERLKLRSELPPIERKRPTEAVNLRNGVFTVLFLTG